MVPKDNRYTNLTVDQTLVVKNKLVANQIDVNTLTVINGGTLPATFENLTTTNLTATNITTANETITDGSTSNLLFISDPSTIRSGMIPQFTTDGNTKVVAIPNLPLISQTNYFFMDGRDGNVTISGGTTTLTRDMYYDTLTITSTGVIIPAGWFIFCKTACINNGIIRMNGGNGANGVAGVGGAGGVATPVTGPSYAGTNGSAGGNTNTNGGSSTSSNTLFGGQGGNGGNSDTKTGGTFTAGQQYLNAATIIGNIGFFTLLPVSTQQGVLVGGGDPGSGGGGGAGGSVGAGGGGGGPGGWIFIIAKSVSGSGTFEATGGIGGNGQAATAGGGGGGGGGGVVYILSSSNSISASQVLVGGGSGGLGTVGGQPGVGGLTGLYQNNILT